MVYAGLRKHELHIWCCCLDIQGARRKGSNVAVSPHNAAAVVGALLIRAGTININNSALQTSVRTYLTENITPN